MPRLRVTLVEGFLISALLYSIVLLIMRWDLYRSCKKPLQLFLLADYVLIIFFRVLDMVTRAYPQHARTLTRISHGAFAFFTCWTFMGTSWFHASHDCLPEAKEYWMFMTWIIFSYVWICVYCITSLLRCYLETAVPRSYDVDNGQGLSNFQIETIPETTLSQEEVQSLSSKLCSICLEEFNSTQTVKRIPVCSHIFHSVCIEDWLTRRNTCPLCRQAVMDANGRLIPNEEMQMSEGGYQPAHVPATAGGYQLNRVGGPTTQDNEMEGANGEESSTGYVAVPVNVHTA